MINLLPPDTKESYRFASYNVSLLRWLSATVVAFFLIGLIGGYGWLWVRQAIKDSAAEVAYIDSGLDKDALSETNKQVVEISDSFNLVQKVLSQEILFSKLLTQMATALPDDTYLAGLNISDVASGSTLDVIVNAANVESATQVQLNLSDPDNQIFAKVDIQNVACDSASAADPDYICKITLRAQFAGNNQYLFINQDDEVKR